MVVTIALVVHQIPILTEIGVDRASAAWYAGMAGLAGVAGKLVTGWLLDRYAARLEELRTTPLVSLAVKCGTEETQGEPVFPQYALLGQHVGSHPDISSTQEILLNTNAP